MNALGANLLITSALKPRAFLRYARKNAKIYCFLLFFNISLTFFARLFLTESFADTIILDTFELGEHSIFNQDCNVEPSRTNLACSVAR